MPVAYQVFSIHLLFFYFLSQDHVYRNNRHRAPSLDADRKQPMNGRVIVDENAGRGTRLWREFQQELGDHDWEYVELSEQYPGIPDVEILDKLLGPDVVLLTGDRALHAQAIERGVRAYTLDEHGQLTRKRLPGMRLRRRVPHSVNTTLKDDYRHPSDVELVKRLKCGFSEKQLKRYRTARRRIRSHFGSADAISQVSVTIGSQAGKHGLICGYVFHVAGNSGVKGLRASEGYCLTAGRESGNACPVIHAVRDLYLLQLEHVPTDLFLVPPASLDLCRRLLPPDAPLPAVEPEQDARHEAVLQRLLQGLARVTLHPCVKGRFHDDMQRKLSQLQRSNSNELTSVDFEKFVAAVLSSKPLPLDTNQLP